MSHALSRTATVVSWIFQVVVAVILFQTLFFKFTAAPESVFIFETLGAEPWGRIGSGAVELIAGILLLIPGRTAWGALLGGLAMVGALGAHLTKLGIEVQGDGGLLFSLAVTVLVGSAIVLFLRRRDLPFVS
jgi:putative oxidoreductase